MEFSSESNDTKKNSRAQKIKDDLVAELNS